MSDKVKQQFVIPQSLVGTRLDYSLSKLLPHFSRETLKKWLLSKQIKVNNQSKPPKYRVTGGESIDINATLAPEVCWQPQAMPLDIIYEDNMMLIVNKPAYFVVHPAPGHPNNTMVNALLHHHPKLAQLPRAGLIHRLDKDTSGLLMVAKTLQAYYGLVTQLQKRNITRQYEAIVQGNLTGGGTVNAAIGRHPYHRTKMAVVAKGKPAITHYRLLEQFANSSRIKVTLETGRTHQIRVHFAHIHHPLIGDPSYGKRHHLLKGASIALTQWLQAFKRQALHARWLQFAHPLTKTTMQFESALPKDMQQLVQLLRQGHHNHR